MSSFFTGNILNEYALSAEKFETVVGLGASKSEVLKIFSIGLSPEDLGQGATYAKLDEWVKKNYGGLSFEAAYDLIQSITVKKFEDAMVELGVRGNPSAIAIMNEVIRKKESSSVVTVNFVNSLPAESEEDKEDEGI